MASKKCVLSNGKKITFISTLVEGTLGSEAAEVESAKVMYICDPQPLFINRKFIGTAKEFMEIQKLGRRYLCENFGGGAEAYLLLTLSESLSDVERLVFVEESTDSVSFLHDFKFGKIEELADKKVLIVSSEFFGYKFDFSAIGEDSDLWAYIEDKVNLHVRSKGFKDEYKLVQIHVDHFYLEKVLTQA